jgi:hypothetical protein
MKEVEMRTPKVTIALVFSMMLATAFASVAVADEDPPGTHRDWGIGAHIRAGGAGLSYGDFLEKGTAWDFELFRQRSDWRYGVGLTFGSLAMKSPYEHEPEWAHFETFAYASRVFRNGESVRPYLQGRFAIARSHPRSTLFAKNDIDSLESGESPTDAHNGIGISLVPGLELDVANGIAIDVAAYLNWWLTSTYPLQDYQGNRPLGSQEDPNNGLEWGGRIGLTWRPMSYEEVVRPSAAPDLSPLPEADRYQDAWGVTRSYGWAYGEVLAINFGASMFNEYVRQANFNQISPRSFWDNIEDGLHFDDNKFKTNQYVHPFNGSTYFNSGRSNGLGFWASTLTAITGATIWEVAGETHPASYNDMIATGIGGIAFGETVYRLSSYLLDNTSTGSGRTWREIGSFLIDPIHGFNRFVSGRASKVQGNPSNPYDWRPPRYYTNFAIGARITGKGESISDSTEVRPVIDLYINHGNPFENVRRKPFDHFDTGVQFNGDDKNTLSRFQIRGDLFSKALGEAAYPKYAIAFTQYFDYVNNYDYEFGGQSFGGTFYSRFRPSDNVGLQARVDLLWSILAAVNAEYSFLAQVENRERFREYDYGPGGGVSAEFGVLHKNRRVFWMGYRAQYVHVRNGSVWNPSETGSNAEHYVQSLSVKAAIPVRGAMNVGFDASVFRRDSDYEIAGLQDITNQRVPQARLYLSWETSR